MSNGIELTSVDSNNKHAFQNDGYVAEVEEKIVPNQETVVDSTVLQSEEPETSAGVQDPTKEYVDEDDFEPIDYEPGPCMAQVARFHRGCQNWFKQHSDILTHALYGGLLCGFAGYFAYAMYYEPPTSACSLESITLLWITCATVFLVALSFIRGRWGGGIFDSVCSPLLTFVSKHWTVIKGIFVLLVAAAILAIIGVTIARTSAQNLIPVGGMIILILLSIVCSTDPGMIQWRIVLWGLGMQFFFAVIILGTDVGYDSFKWLGDLVVKFIDFVEDGVVFVFGEAYTDHYFSMRVMPVVIYFYASIALLYHWGVVQIIVSKFGWFMEKVVGTTAGESTAAAANCFLGMDQTPMLISPLLGRMTDSEIHCILTGGFATIAGDVMASYIFMGVPANHLISASIISAPCALAVAKIFMPETKKTKFAPGEEVEFQPMGYHNGFDAACNGAVEGVKIVAGILANIIAFLSLLACLNGILGWLGARVGLAPPEYQPLTFELICSYVLWPVAFIMGVPSQDCLKVAELLGIKTFTNEFIAYTDLSIIIDNSNQYREHIANNGSYSYDGNDVVLENYNGTTTDETLIGGILSRRAEVITTYALCGFANVGSIGINLGVFGALAPKKMSVVTSCVVRAMIAGTVTCYLTACIAGLFYDPSVEESVPYDDC